MCSIASFLEIAAFNPSFLSPIFFSKVGTDEKKLKSLVNEFRSLKRSEQEEMLDIVRFKLPDSNSRAVQKLIRGVKSFAEKIFHGPQSTDFRTLCRWNRKKPEGHADEQFKAMNIQSFFNRCGTADMAFCGDILSHLLKAFAAFQPNGLIRMGQDAKLNERSKFFQLAAECLIAHFLASKSTKNWVVGGLGIDLSNAEKEFYSLNPEEQKEVLQILRTRQEPDGSEQVRKTVFPDPISGTRTKPRISCL